MHLLPSFDAFTTVTTIPYQLQQDCRKGSHCMGIISDQNPIGHFTKRPKTYTIIKTTKRTELSIRTTCREYRRRAGAGREAGRGCPASRAAVEAAPGPARMRGSCPHATAAARVFVVPAPGGAAPRVLAVCGALRLAPGAVCGTLLWRAQNPVLR